MKSVDLAAGDSSRMARWKQHSLDHLVAGCATAGVEFTARGFLIGDCRCTCHCRLPSDPQPCFRCNDSRVTGRGTFGMPIPCIECEGDEFNDILLETFTEGVDPWTEWHEHQFAYLLPTSTVGHQVRALLGVHARTLGPGASPAAGDAWPKVITFCGLTGTGKTHGALAIARELVLRRPGTYAVFAEAPVLLDTFKEAFAADGRTGLAAREYRPLYCDVLIIDDLGAETGSKWEQAELFKLINARYAANRLTIITTNLLTPETAPRERLWSRVFGEASATVIRTDGPDMRQRRPAASGNAAHTR